jgi:hypothetical protein
MMMHDAIDDGSLSLPLSRYCTDSSEKIGGVNSVIANHQHSPSHKKHHHTLIIMMSSSDDDVAVRKTDPSFRWMRQCALHQQDTHNNNINNNNKSRYNTRGGRECFLARSRTIIPRFKIRDIDARSSRYRRYRVDIALIS